MYIRISTGFYDTFSGNTIGAHWCDTIYMDSFPCSLMIMMMLADVMMNMMMLTDNNDNHDDANQCYVDDDEIVKRENLTTILRLRMKIQKREGIVRP